MAEPIANAYFFLVRKHVFQWFDNLPKIFAHFSWVHASELHQRDPVIFVRW